MMMETMKMKRATRTWRIEVRFSFVWLLDQSFLAMMTLVCCLIVSLLLQFVVSVGRFWASEIKWLCIYGSIAIASTFLLYRVLC